MGHPRFLVIMQKLAWSTAIDKSQENESITCLKPLSKSQFLLFVLGFAEIDIMTLQFTWPSNCLTQGTHNSSNNTDKEEQSERNHLYLFQNIHQSSNKEIQDSRIMASNWRTSMKQNRDSKAGPEYLKSIGVWQKTSFKGRKIVFHKGCRDKWTLYWTLSPVIQKINSSGSNTKM